MAVLRWGLGIALDLHLSWDAALCCKLIAGLVLFFAFWKVAVDHNIVVNQRYSVFLFCDLGFYRELYKTSPWAYELSNCNCCWIIPLCSAESYRSLPADRLFTALLLVTWLNVPVEFLTVLNCHKFGFLVYWFFLIEQKNFALLKAYKLFLRLASIFC